MDTKQADEVMDGGNALGAFLRARRELLTPEQAGLSSYGRRRVAGLRREEVALLAGVSTDYYTRLEQGRERHPSQQVVSAVARALQLDEESQEHASRLARPAVRRRRPAVRPERVSPQLLRLLAGWTDTPAFVIGRAYDVLASNDLADALHSGFGHRDNLVRMVFLDPAGRDFYRDWESAAQLSVATLRVAAGAAPDDPRLTELVGELSMKSPVFRRLWARHDVRAKTRGLKRLCHPQVGELDLYYEAFSVNSAPGQQLLVYQAEPGTPAADALALLGTLVAS